MSKMVLVVRTDLGMGVGKVAAQCAHACLGAYEEAMRVDPGTVISWLEDGAAKIVLQVGSEHDLLQLEAQAIEHGLIHCLIQDAGRTQIAAGSRTVLAIGPAPADKIDTVTRHLRLL
jgi:peptidyl-tRNA hydrolase, PTH2 family